MSRPVFVVNKTQGVTSSIDEEGRRAFDLYVEKGEIRTLRHPKCVFSSQTGQLVFKVVEVKQLPGPPVDGRLYCRVTVEPMR